MLKNRLDLEKKMKKFRNLLILSLTIAGFLLAGTAAKADTFLTLSAPYQMGPGGVFTFDATVTNTDLTNIVYLNGDSLTGAGLLLLDDSPFLSNWPLSLDPLHSYTGELFTVTAPAWGPGSNFYTGAFILQGGASGGAQDTLATAVFDVQVTPEPSSFLLLGTGVLTFGLLTGRKFLV